MKSRGQMLTETFKRMDQLGITEAEDIIAELARELEEAKDTVQITEEPPILSGGFDLTEDIKKRIYMIEYRDDGTAVLYLDGGGNRCVPPPHGEI